MIKKPHTTIKVGLGSGLLYRIPAERILECIKAGDYHGALEHAKPLVRRLEELTKAHPKQGE
jgi:hypothetical protein